MAVITPFFDVVAGVAILAGRSSLLDTGIFKTANTNFTIRHLLALGFIGYGGWNLWKIERAQDKLKKSLGAEDYTEIGICDYGLVCDQNIPTPLNEYGICQECQEQWEYENEMFPLEKGAEEVPDWYYDSISIYDEDADEFYGIKDIRISSDDDDVSDVIGADSIYLVRNNGSYTDSSKTYEDIINFPLEKGAEEVPDWYYDSISIYDEDADEFYGIKDIRISSDDDDVSDVIGADSIYLVRNNGSYTDSSKTYEDIINFKDFYNIHAFGAESLEVKCENCQEVIGTEEEVYDEESVEWYNIDGEVYCPACKNEVIPYEERFGAEPMLVQSDGMMVELMGFDGSYRSDGEVKVGYTTAAELGFEPKQLKPVMWVWDDIEGYGAFMATEDIRFV